MCLFAAVLVSLQQPAVPSFGPHIMLTSTRRPLVALRHVNKHADRLCTIYHPNQIDCKLTPLEKARLLVHAMLGAMSLTNKAPSGMIERPHSPTDSLPCLICLRVPVRS